MRWLATGFLILGIASVASVVTAANSVPATRADLSSRSIGPRDLAPATCASLVLTNIVTGSGIFSGTNAADLMLGSSGIDTMTAGNGNDCVLGGGAAPTSSAADSVRTSASGVLVSM